MAPLAYNSKQINWLRKAKKKQKKRFGLLFLKDVWANERNTSFRHLQVSMKEEHRDFYVRLYSREAHDDITQHYHVHSSCALVFSLSLTKKSANRRLGWIFISMCWLLNVIVVNLARQSRRRYRPQREALRTASSHSGCWVKSFGTGLLVQRPHSWTVSTAPSQLHTSTYEVLISITGLKDSLTNSKGCEEGKTCIACAVPVRTEDGVGNFCLLTNAAFSHFT